MPPAQQQQQGGDTSLTPFWIAIGIFALCWGIWYFAHPQIAFVILKLRLWEAELINLLTGSANNLIWQIKNTDPNSADINSLVAVSDNVGAYFKYPVTIILIILAVVIYLGKPTMRYKKTYSMDSLAEAEKLDWPQITPVVKLDLVNTDIDKGPWAMALSPMQFAKKYNLLQEEKIFPSDPNVIQRPKTIAILQREDAHRILALQTGLYWKGVEHLNKHTKALLAAFAARANRDQDGSRKLLLQIAASTEAGKLNFSGTDELLVKHFNNKKVQHVMGSHAFVLTMVASMLKLAREDGVLASADFLWLKPIDRPLWFMLNSIGRRTPFVEVAGVYAHWLAECELGRKIAVPIVEEAVNALDMAIKEVVYTPDEKEQ